MPRPRCGAAYEYIKNWRPNRHPEGPVFLTEEGEPFSLGGFQTYMGRLGDRFEAAGIPNWMAHRARHYWATSAHRVGMTVFDIAAEGGWRDLKMVQRYTKARPFEELQRLPTPLSAVLGKRAS
ncbi:MAG TPA: tyrosine-type recombinase/integrase [Candidatus Limnocylindria bacterium]|jgi:integrase